MKSAGTKALVIARIKDNHKVKASGWDRPKHGAWDRRAHKADGGPVTDPDVLAQLNDSGPKPVTDPALLAQLNGGSAPHTKDFSWSQAITDIPHEIAEDASKGASSLMAKPEPGAWGAVKNLGNTAAGAAGLVFSPVTGLYHSVIGHTMANAEHAVGSLIAPDIAAKDDPDAMYKTAKGDVDTAMAAMPASKIMPSAPAAPAAPIAAGTDVVSAAERASQVAPNPINVPRAFASDNIAVQRAGQMARNVPIVGDSIPRATGEMADQMGDAVKSIASHYGEGSGPNVANRIGRGIGEAADAETTASTNAARTSDDALLADWQRSHDSALGQVAQHETNALAHARQLTGDMSPQDMGQALITRLRSGEQEAQALKDRLYASADQSGTAASINADTVGNVRSLAAQRLEDVGRVVDKELTPASSKMLDELQKFSGMNIDNKAVGAGSAAPLGEIPVKAAVNIRGIEQVRKRLNSFSQAATNDADRGAAREIIRSFDKWESDAVDNHLFSGSPEALQDVLKARNANREWRQRFYNDRDDADKLINKVVTGEITPQEMSNWIVGNSQIGSKGVSSRLLTRLGETTGNDPEAMNAIRGGVANRLFGTTEGVAEKNPAKVANDIHEFFNGSGRDVATRLYTPQQRQAALNYASTLRRAQDAREAISAVAKNTKPTAMQVGSGPMQELATSILGKSGKTDEALYSAIDSYARSGARGDVKTLSDIVRNIPEKDRGDLAGAIIRNLGQSKTTGEFSPELFVSEWNKYTPQAKAVLFGNAGPQRQALDDIALISQRYKDVGRRFGNPSGTAQNAAGIGLLGAIFTAPLVTIPTIIGGAVFAKMLSAPATAVKTANLLKTSLAMSKAPSAQRLALFNSTANSFAKSAEKAGSNISAPDFMRQLQGPVPASADGKQDKPPRIGQ